MGCLTRCASIRDVLDGSVPMELRRGEGRWRRSRGVAVGLRSACGGEAMGPGASLERLEPQVGLVTAVEG